MPEREILLQTPHGSHLYGTSHSESDFDIFTVVTKKPYGVHNSKQKYAKQRIKDGIDETVVDMSTFMAGAARGVPQYLEALFSPIANIDQITELRKSYFAGYEVIPRYLRTIKSFSYDTRVGGKKKKRHALRLGLDARDILRYGRFNPRLSSGLAEELQYWAETLDADSCYEKAINFVWGVDTPETLG